MSLGISTTRPIQDKVDETTTRAVRALIVQFGYGRTQQLLQTSPQVLDELRSGNGIVRARTLDRIKARLEELSGREEALLAG